MLQILDYGICNVGAVHNILRRAGVPSRIVSDPAEIASASSLILPGVGHFATGMGMLRERGFIEPLRDHAIVRRRPLLGICLGMQLLTEHSEEGDVAGLGFVPAKVVKFDTARMARPLPIPHMGWSKVEVSRSASYTGEMLPESKFYFTHSYHVDALPAEHAVLIADYGVKFVAGFQCGNVAGVQFHPEKSHVYGRALLESFAKASDEL
jgi:glutamine amidotransferase